MPISPDLAPLLQRPTPLAPTMLIDEAADRFLTPEYERLLSIPVVDGKTVVGSISRFQLNQIFLRRYGRELHGKRTIATAMNPAPLLVDLALPLEGAARQVAATVSAPLREDFIVVDADRYVGVGVGVVLDLLRAMEERVAANAARLEAAYHQLQASQGQLVQSEKMASLGQMVAGIAHEINTPLGYVRNNVELLDGALAQIGAALSQCSAVLELFAGGGEVAEAQLTQQLLAAGAALDELRENRTLEDNATLVKDTLYGVDQIREIVTSLKSFSRLDQARQAQVSLNDCLDQTLVIARSLTKGKVEIVRRYGEVPPVRCAPAQINQVFLNLVTNAVQAIEHGRGVLLLRTGCDQGHVWASIQDNGKGIAAEHLPRIFDPFFTTKPVGQGTGLGLSISYQIVQAHGGRIQVASKPGQGTRFIVSLPAVEPAATTAASATALA